MKNKKVISWLIFVFIGLVTSLLGLYIGKQIDNANDVKYQVESLMRTQSEFNALIDFLCLNVQYYKGQRPNYEPTPEPQTWFEIEQWSFRSAGKCKVHLK